MNHLRTLVVLNALILIALPLTRVTAQEAKTPTPAIGVNGNHATDDLKAARPPVILSAEAHAGRPYGIVSRRRRGRRTVVIVRIVLRSNLLAGASILKPE